MHSLLIVTITVSNDNRAKDNRANGCSSLNYQSVMIRKRLIARRREKDKESLRYNRGDEEEDDWTKVEDEEEAIEDKEENKYSKHCH